MKIGSFGLVTLCLLLSACDSRVSVSKLEAQLELAEHRGQLMERADRSYAKLKAYDAAIDVSIAAGKYQLLELPLLTGRNTVVIAACDSNCDDIDMEVIDSEGKRLGIDDSDSDQPIVEIEESAVGKVFAKLTMTACAASSCAAAVQALEYDAQVGTGTCFAVSPDGLVLTADHVIEGMTSIDVKFNDGKTYSAYVVRRSSDNDVALLKVAARPPDWLGIADVNKAKVGDPTFTLGYPAPQTLGDEQKYSEGIIASLSGNSNEATLLHVSVPVQAGNSGGPLVDLEGEVLGVIIGGITREALGAEPQLVNYARYAQIAHLLASKVDALPTREVATSKAAAIERASGSACFLSGS